MDIKRRDAIAHDINLEAITSSKRNAEVLRKLRDNFIWEDDNTLYIVEADDEEDEDDDGEEDNIFRIDEGDDLSWLGYFIGRNESLDDLTIWFLPQERERIDGFIHGVKYNRSLREFSIGVRGIDVGLQNLCSFFRENDNLDSLFLHNCEIGRERAHELALALGRRDVNSSLIRLCLDNNGIEDADFAIIAQALLRQPQLRRLRCAGNNVGRISCEKLGAMMRCRSFNLIDLCLGNDIDDVGLQSLVPGLCNNHNLTYLSITGPITAVGLRSLANFLQSDSCNLRSLCVSLRLGDEEATALADALKGNASLKTLVLPHHEHSNRRRNMTDVGWSAFSRLLCDTSSIHNTYLSNHSLTDIGDYNTMDDTPRFVTDLLKMNTEAYQINGTRNQKMLQSLKRRKILMSNPDLDMRPLFEYKLKLLPWVKKWFGRSIQLCGDEVGEWKESVPELQSRELSAVYKFVRDMPLLISDGYWTNVLTESKTKKQKLQVEKRKLELMLQRAEKGIKRAEKNERCAAKRLRH